TKPIHWAVLRQRVRRLLHQCHLYKQLERSNQELQARIGELKQTELALRESEERYALVAQSTHDGLWDWNLRTNEIYFSPRWKSMLGYTDDEINNSLAEWFKRVHPEDMEQFKGELSAHLAGLTTHFENEHRLLHQDGEYRWMLCQGIAVRDAAGNPYRIAGSQTDITLNKANEAKLIYQAFHDPLTGLPNRMRFMEQIESALKRSKEERNYVFALLFLDLDRFKVVNDSLGHTFGDRLLVAIAQKLKACVTPKDSIARLGGDEFTILLEDIKDITDATKMADRIYQELSRPFDLSGHEVFTTVSIGIAISTLGYDRPEDLLRDADMTMYRAKALGKGRLEVFDPTLHDRAMARLQLEIDLRRALERQELQLHYQPIVSLNNGRIAGYEALVRWQHPQRGWVSPVEFIPLAEETGLIIPMGLWVLRQACQQLRTWQQQQQQDPPLTVNVNLSGKQFDQPNLIENIKQVLQETGLDASSLKLEITESVLVENATPAVAILKQLKALGIKLAIDDFGTGYSSLSYLHQMPIDTLKIDRSFINNVDCDPEKIEMIRTIVSLAWNLGMNVVAEGVETKKQMYQLQALKCEYGQGYYFSRPLDANAVKTLKQFDLQQAGTPPVQLKHQMPTRHVQFPDNSYQQATQTFLLTSILDLSANNSLLKPEDESANFFNSSLRPQ
ncbi:MAG TPA: diguanylate cyclase, partial [Cyanobacteria bacterium UBA11049]|nr:diguanylate cyclase [Cyanobacteria bacterium UBA11049]